jgi:hypothetical protein
MHLLVSLSNVDVGSGFIRHICTGSLIAPDIVLTAAHCIEDVTVETMVVVFNTANYLMANSTMVSVSGFSQPGFTYEGFAARNDIALLFLSSCVNFTHLINVNPTEDGKNDSTCTDVEITAFGKSERIPSDLYVPDGEMRNLHDGQYIHSHEVCKTAFSEYILSIKFGRKYISESTKSLISESIPESVGCYGGEITARVEGYTCDGDSGSPVFSKATGELIGITSFTSEVCGTLPNYFTRVSHFVDWIQAEVAARAIKCDQGSVHLSKKSSSHLSNTFEKIQPLLTTLSHSIEGECSGPFNILNSLLSTPILQTSAVTVECGIFLTCISSASAVASTDIANALLDAFPRNLEGYDALPFLTRRAVGRILLCSSAFELYFETIERETQNNSNYMDNAPANTECNR